MYEYIARKHIQDIQRHPKTSNLKEQKSSIRPGAEPPIRVEGGEGGGKRGGKEGRVYEHPQRDCLRERDRAGVVEEGSDVDVGLCVNVGY